MSLSAWTHAPLVTPGGPNARPGRGEGHNAAQAWIDCGRIALVLVAALAIWLHLLPFAGPLGLAAVAIGGWPIFHEAVENLRERTMTMELSMTIALGAALAIGESVTALIITAFVLAAEILEDLTVGRGRTAIADLLDVLPRTVAVRGAEGVATVSLDSLRAGEAVLVAPGTLVPVDGVVIAGHSFVDQARITGESMPVEKTAGAAVFAGTINQSGALEVRVERIGAETSFGKIVEAVERAEEARAPVQRLADRLAGYLVYFALGAAALTFAMTHDWRATISVVIVAGACGIAAGTPLAILGGIGRAARLGAIVKGGRYLEALGRIDTVAFDKTGTLTNGTPEVVRLAPAPGVSPETLLAAAAVAERRSEHPLGLAIVAAANAARASREEPDTFEYTPGRGIAARAGGTTLRVGNRAFFSECGITVSAPPAHDGTTEVAVARDFEFLGTIELADTVRVEARAAVDELRRMRVRTMLLTGDGEGVAAAVATALGVDAWEAELLPSDKAARITALIGRGRKVAMVGDGINDAPALVNATVGIAMGSGTDVARESADVVLLGNDLLRFTETLRVARRTRTIVFQNFAGTIAVDIAGIALAAFGFLNPLAAAFIHVASELAFILNSTRMLPVRTKGKA